MHLFTIKSLKEFSDLKTWDLKGYTMDIIFEKSLNVETEVDKKWRIKLEFQVKLYM